MAQLYFEHAPMDAGKTDNIIKARYTYTSKGMKTFVLSPGCDTRIVRNGKIGILVSRTGSSCETNMIDNTDDLLCIKERVSAEDVKCVFIDEAQFFHKEWIDILSDIVDELNVPVICYGLRSDSNQEPFEGSLRLFMIADVIRECKTICTCTRKAIYTLRKDTGNNDKIAIGGNEMYYTRCRRCAKLERK